MRGMYGCDGCGSSGTASKEELASALVAAEQANVAKTDFPSRMSHEIRTPDERDHRYERHRSTGDR